MIPATVERRARTSSIKEANASSTWPHPNALGSSGVFLATTLLGSSSNRSKSSIPTRTWPTVPMLHTSKR